MSSHDQLTRDDKLRITNLRKWLISWYRENGRSFPWREPDASVYERICVEVLLQRTRAETVAGIYPWFFARFDSWQAIADEHIEQLELALRPLGLWRRRAQSLQKLAAYAASHDGLFPSDETQLAKVPAVGQYVANAILLFQHGEPRPLIDVNMARVIERFVRPRRLVDIRYDPWLQSAARWYASRDPINANWAILDFAAVECRARQPLCSTCQLSRRCEYRSGKNTS